MLVVVAKVLLVVVTTLVVVISAMPNAWPTAWLMLAMLVTVGVVFLRLASCVNGVTLTVMTLPAPDTTARASMEDDKLVC